MKFFIVKIQNEIQNGKKSSSKRQMWTLVFRIERDPKTVIPK